MEKLLGSFKSPIEMYGYEVKLKTVCLVVYIYFSPATFNYSGSTIKRTDGYVHLEFEFCKECTMEEERNNVVVVIIIIIDFLAYKLQMWKQEKDEGR